MTYDEDNALADYAIMAAKLNVHGLFVTTNNQLSVTFIVFS